MNKTTPSQSILKTLGPGILFAGAAIGGSHLVQSTRAGANYGLTMIFIVLFINVLKYPFFEFGQRYVAATGESLLQGYRKLGKTTLGGFLLLCCLTAIFNIAGVVLITTGLAQNLFGIGESSQTIIAILITLFSLLIIGIGGYSFLEKIMKFMVIGLTLITIFTVCIAASAPKVMIEGFVPLDLNSKVGFGFLIALMGWMPAPIETSVWPSLWAVENNKINKVKAPFKQVLLDFHIGYIGTAILAIFFVLLGYFLMYGSGKEFSSSSVAFTSQLIDMYVSTLGNGGWYIITMVVFFTMLSTTFTVFDAYPRTIYTGLTLLFPKLEKKQRLLKVIVTIFLSCVGVSVILFLPKAGFKSLIDFTTIVCFLTAPLFARVNLKVVTSEFMPKEYRPKKWIVQLSWLSIVCLSILSFAYILSITVF